MKAKNKIILSIVIPVYNGENYIDNCIHSIINETTINENIFDLIEILIINDGSKDNSLEKANNLANEWNGKIRKNFIKVISKENGQYGSVINCALKNISGKYIKVLDVDDIFNSDYFVQIVQIIAGLKIDIDVIVTDYIFDKVIQNKQIIYKWNKYFEPYKILKMNQIKFPKLIITMHSIIYNSNFLKNINYSQLENVYYSDSQYSSIPFAQAKKLYYINIPLYRYYIGRNDQSISIKTMVKNRNDQFQVMYKIINELLKIEINSRAQKKYVWRIAKNMFEWQCMIIAHDKSIKNRGKFMYENLNNILKICKKNNFYGYMTIRKGALSTLIRITKGKNIVPLIRFGEKLYARFKLNIMADWD
ncbi:MAG: glycosyltransferase family 2 protein [Mycoplasmataceae bacterium]|nr:glycosyltransferase family 2 protein [Mycoplasmataceae bacterium]